MGFLFLQVEIFYGNGAPPSSPSGFLASNPSRGGKLIRLFESASVAVDLGVRPRPASGQVPRYLANRQGMPFEYSDAMRATRLSDPTLRKLLMAFEAIFLVRVISSEGGEKRPVVFFEDQGEATHLQTSPRTELEDFERFLYANLRTQWMYRPEKGIRLVHPGRKDWILGNNQSVVGAGTLLHGTA